LWFAIRHHAINPDTSEELAWERLREMQREIENRRATAPDADEVALYQAQLLVERARGFVRAIRARMPPAD
jgi:hypothetical protein